LILSGTEGVAIISEVWLLVAYLLVVANPHQVIINALTIMISLTHNLSAARINHVVHYIFFFFGGGGVRWVLPLTPTKGFFALIGVTKN